PPNGPERCQSIQASVSLEGVGMTALVSDTVERTFSGVGRFLTGLPGSKTHEAGRQDLGELVEAFGKRHPVGAEGVDHKGLHLEPHSTARRFARTVDPLRSAKRCFEAAIWAT